MGTVVLACRTIAEELNAAIAATGVDYPVFWVESGLHNYPERLRRRIQEEIDRLGNVRRILLAFGYCGNALLGVKSAAASIVFPKVEDCISLLLGSTEARRRLSREVGTYYLTKGWIEYENSLWSEYNHCVRKYGPERARRLMQLMLNHYKRLVLIDTGAYEVEEYRRKTEKFAAVLGLEHVVVSGSFRLFAKLLTGPWDEEFVIVGPGEEVGLEHLVGNGGEAVGQLGLFGLQSDSVLWNGGRREEMDVDLARELGDLNEEAVLEGVRLLKQQGVDPLEILGRLQEGMAVVGRRFQEKEYFLSDLVRSADIFTRAVDLIGDLKGDDGAASLGTMVIGTVREDIHDIGKNLVASLMSCNGFRVYDLGVDTPPERFIKAIKEHRPEFVGISCLLTTAIENMKETVEKINSAGLREGVTILIGGGPVNETVCRYVGADYYCTTAQEAVDLCKRLVGAPRVPGRGGGAEQREMAPVGACGCPPEGGRNS